MSRINTGSKSHAMEIIFPLLLFGLFAVMSLFLVIIGSDVYAKIVKNSDDNSKIRTSVSYLANKMRAYDSEEYKVYVDRMSDVEVLVFEEDVAGYTYQNLVYYYDGALREVMIQKGYTFSPEFGELLVEGVTGFWLETNPERDVVSFTVAGAKGTQQSMEITYRSGDIR